MEWITLLHILIQEVTIISKHIKQWTNNAFICTKTHLNTFSISFAWNHCIHARLYTCICLWLFSLILWIRSWHENYVLIQHLYTFSKLVAIYFTIIGNNLFRIQQEKKEKKKKVAFNLLNLTSLSRSVVKFYIKRHLAFTSGQWWVHPTF